MRNNIFDYFVIVILFCFYFKTAEKFFVKMQNISKDTFRSEKEPLFSIEKTELERCEYFL